MKTAIVYARVSTVKQASDELPIQSQIEQCNARSESLGATVLRAFIDDGISGRGDNRPQFQAAIEFCELNRVDYFITWSTSRFARNKLDAALYKKRLANCETDMAYVSLSIDRSTDGGWMTEGVMEIFDEFFSRQVSSDTRRSMLKNAQDGYWNGGIPIYGYSPAVDPENSRRKRLFVDPDEAHIVKRIFNMRLSGEGPKSIAEKLNNEGLDKRGRSWTKKTVGALLRNPSITGKTVFGRRSNATGRKVEPDNWLIVQSHEPIIDQKSWDSVQTIMDREIKHTGGSQKSTFLFTGLLVCYTCGKNMNIETATGRSSSYSYYNCRSAQQGSGCRNRRISARKIDNWLVDTICEQIFNRSNLNEVVTELNATCSQWARETRKRREHLSKQLSILESKNSKIFDLFELHGRDCPNLSDLTKRLRANNTKIKVLETELTVVDAAQEPSAVSDNDIARLTDILTDIIRTSQNPQRIRSLFSSFINRIEVKDSSITINYNPSTLIQKQTVHSSGHWRPGQGLLRTRKIVVELPDRFRRAA